MKIKYLKNRKERKLNLRFPTAILSLAVFFLIGFSAVSQNLGVSAAGTPPDPSAMLDVAASDKGVLIPRMSVSERDNINTPANGLIVYNTDCGLLNYYDCNTWREVGEKFGFPNLLGQSSGEVIIGAKEVSENETGVAYKIPAVSGTGITYTWSVPAGASVASGQGTDIITVDYTTSGDGFVCVEATNFCGSIVKTCIYVEICPLPVQPGVIAGDATPDKNTAGNIYSISAVPNTNDYTWTVPAGATITAGQGTTSITVDFDLGASDGDICVVANNDCGTGSAQCLTLSMQCPLPSVPTASAGTNINGTSFDANWSTSTGVVDYYLDVASDNTFTTFVSGFNNLNVGNVITYNVTGLTCETDYYYRVRAENACGFSIYSSTITVTSGSCWTCGDAITDSRDSETYQTVQIGSQCWLAENLNYATGSGSWCYDNNPSNCTTYGRMYDWATAMNGSSSSNLTPSGVQGLCPSGWHFPSDAEWCQMENTVEPGTDASCSGTTFRGTNTGKKLKSASPTWDGDNTSGFAALSAGYYNGSSTGLGTYAIFWSTTDSGTDAWRRLLSSGNNGVSRDLRDKALGYSVRCIMD